jgi:phosphoglycolate phosphatase-like HAD superfamily hydrolase
MTPTLAILDFDGTLFNIQVTNFDSFRNTLAEKILLETGHTTSLKPILKSLADLYSINPEYARKCYIELDLLEVKSECLIIPHTKLLLEKLKLKNIPVIILSNNCEEVIKNALIRNSLDGLIKEIYGRKIGLDGKPDPTILNTILEKYHRLGFTKIVSCGDRATDNSVLLSSKVTSLGFKYYFCHPNDIFSIIKYC